MCTSIAIPKREMVSTWQTNMYPALSSEPYVSCSYSAKVYGMSQLDDFRDIADGTPVAIMASSQCQVAGLTADELQESHGLRLMVRLAMNAPLPLKNYHEDLNQHGKLLSHPGHKRVIYSLRVLSFSQLEETFAIIKEALPYAQEFVEVFVENGGRFRLPHTGYAEIDRMLMETMGVSRSEHYLIKGSAESAEQAHRDLDLLKMLRGISQPILFLED